MKIKDLLYKIERAFMIKLDAKTGWGRKEIMRAYKEAENEVLMEMLGEIKEI